MPRDYVERILKARVYDVARQTPLDVAPILSTRLDNRVLIKREDLQPVFSFKIRGAYNKIASLTQTQRAQGVIAVSAGNHAQGVALAATHLGVRSLIVMPKTAPAIKVESTRRFGAEVVLHGNYFDETKTQAAKIVEQRGMVVVPPYDDPTVIAGQGNGGDGDSPPAHRRHSCGVCTRRRRWANCRNGRVYQVIVARDQGDWCRTRGRT